MFRTFCALAVLFAVVTLAACSDNPAQPSAVVGVPTPTLPANGAQIAFSTQPVTLVAANAAVSGTATVTYTFEVATDSAFASKVQSKDVAPNSNGQTSVALDNLTAGKDYYWHVRAKAGNTSGVFSSPMKFTVVPISAPAQLSPANGAVVSAWPTLVVANAQTSGTTGALTYKFEVSPSSAFDNIIATGTVPEGSGQTSFTPTGALPNGQTTLYWRATASDANGNASASGTANFVLSASVASRIASQEGLTLWSGVQPPGTTGHATLGDNWNIQTLHHLPSNTFFQSPSLEMLQIFDMLDRGFDPDGAISWINSNGYSTIAKWYPPPDKAVIGLAYVYIAARNKVTVNGTWDIVLKFE